MKPETAEALIGRIEAIEAEVGVLQSTVGGEALAPNQRQYLARCFDLLRMELAAVRSYIAGLHDRERRTLLRTLLLYQLSYAPAHLRQSSAQRMAGARTRASAADGMPRAWYRRHG